MRCGGKGTWINMTQPIHNKTKNVLHITFDMRIGGTEMVVKNIIEGNKNKDIVMSIFCIEEPLGPWGQDLKRDGVNVTSLSRKNGFDFSVVNGIKAHIKKHNIDILHCHQYTPWVYGTLASIGTKTKVIFTEHGRFYPDFSSWKRRFVNPLLALFTYKITAISQATKQALKDYEYLSWFKIDVVYNGIKGLNVNKEAALAIREKFGITPSTIVFGTIARLDPIKNHTLMLHAFAKTRQKLPSAKLFIVGDGDLMSELKDLAVTLNIKDAVIFTGYISYPKDYLAAFDIFLLSSLSEGTSMTLLEAMSLKKPCIVTDAGGNKEIVAHEETGLVTDNNNVDQFSAAMLKLSGNPALNKQYSEQAFQRFTNLFDVQHMSEEYAKCYGENK